METVVTNELPALQCNGQDWRVLSASDLDAAVKNSINILHTLNRQAQAEARERLFPALLEVKRRYRAGEQVSEAETFYEYLEINGINPSTFRTWQARDIDHKILSVWGKAKYEAENHLTHDASCDCDDCWEFRRSEEATGVKAEDFDVVKMVDDQAKEAEAMFDAQADELPPLGKPSKQRAPFAGGPLIGRISRLGAKHAIGATDRFSIYREGTFNYRVATKDFSLLVEADSIADVRKEMTARFGKIEVKRHDILDEQVQIHTKEAEYCAANPHFALNRTALHLKAAIESAEGIRKALTQQQKLSENLKRSAKANISGMQTAELRKSLREVDGVIKTLKSISLSSIKIPTLTALPQKKQAAKCTPAAKATESQKQRA